MEDAHIAVDMPSKPDHLFLAVFDGHGGSGAAHYAEENMVRFIENTVQWKNYLQSGATDASLLGEALIQAFHDIDEAMRTHQKNSLSRDISGCTSVTAMITPNIILCANAGDSRCVLGTNGFAKEMSEDHKPYNEIERNRIENAGGSVSYKRVDGDLAVSRALGDFQYKQRFDLHAKDQKVTYLPDITIHERTSEDEALILACDGVWDVMTNVESTDIVRNAFQNGVSSMQEVAEHVIDVAFNKGSRDNISAVVVALSASVQLMKQASPKHFEEKTSFFDYKDDSDQNI